MKSKDTQVGNCRVIDIETKATDVGDLVVGHVASIGFVPKRVYYLYDIPANSERGGHAHKNLEQIIVAVAGSFDVEIYDGNTYRTITLNQPRRGLKLPPGLWRELKNFSGGAICLVLASHEYDESDYIRQQRSFIDWKHEV